MSRGQPINRDRWPDDPSQRAFFELLDGVHRENGTKSLRTVAAAMNLAHSRVSKLLHSALPADDRQAGNLIRALGGSAEDIQRGLTLYHRIQSSAAGEIALDRRGWSLARDPKGARHWQPRARGVSNDGEQGWRFQGRAAALTRIVSWLRQPQPGRQVLVVTGSPGAGKSAVLGRVVTTADARIRASLPPGDTTVLADVGSVSCAVHARCKTALEVASEIARAASAAMPTEPADLAFVIRNTLGGQAGARFRVIIDALDEAVSPAQARVVIDSVVLPLAEACSDVGVQVLVGTRRRDDGGDLLGRFGPALDLLDLDDPRYFEVEDLAAYALACLQLVGDERPGNPYADDRVAVPLATRIAKTAGRNFLIAGLIARTHGLHDEQAVDPARPATTATVQSALDGYLRRLPPAGGVPANRLLTALAFAEAPGLPTGLWQLAVKALYREDITMVDLALFARSAAANFLVETTAIPAADPGDLAITPSYQLFHQALSDTLIAARGDFIPRAADERALARAFAERGRAASWQDAPEYLLRSLPGHAHAANLTDDLLTDNAYLLHADLRRLLQVADAASSAPACDRARLLRLTPQAATAGSAERAAMFSVTEVLENLRNSYARSSISAPYSAVWAASRPSAEHSVLEGHSDKITSICTFTQDGDIRLAAGSDDGLIQLWAPSTNTHQAVMQSPAPVWSICAVDIGGRPHLASGCGDGTVRIWDPDTGIQISGIQGHSDAVAGVCKLTHDNQSLMATGGLDGTIRIWDLITENQIAISESGIDSVWCVCALTLGSRTLIAAGGDRGSIVIWDPAADALPSILQCDSGYFINSMCTFTQNSKTMLAACADGKIWIWDIAASTLRSTLKEPQVWAICAFSLQGRTLLATGSEYGTVGIWDPGDGTRQSAHPEFGREINSICTFTVDGHSLIATGGHDRTMRVWDPATHAARSIAEDPSTGGFDELCSVALEGGPLLAASPYDPAESLDGMIRVFDPGTGAERPVLLDAGQKEITKQHSKSSVHNPEGARGWSRARRFRASHRVSGRGRMSESGGAGRASSRRCSPRSSSAPPRSARRDCHSGCTGRRRAVPAGGAGPGRR
jgi:WD40 repeat protein